MQKAKVFIVILNYNGGDDLRKCLDSVYKLNYPNFEVVVIDNDSDDNSFEEARRRFRKFHFIKNSRNLGFSAGNNVAIKWVLEKMADYVFLLNNDAVIEKNTLKKLVRVMEQNDKMGIVSPIIYKGKSKKVWFAGGKINWWKMRTEHKTRNIKRRVWNIENKIWSMKYKTAVSNSEFYGTDYITGCAMLIKRDVFAEIGLLDEDFFLYYEDADFSWRARMAGFKLGVLPKTAVYHFEKSLENPKKIYWLVLSGILFFKKNSPWNWRLYLSVYLFLRQLKNKRRLIGNPNNQEALLIQKAYQKSSEYFKRGR